VRRCTYLLPIHYRAHLANEIDRDRAELGKIESENGERPNPLE